MPPFPANALLPSLGTTVPKGVRHFSTDECRGRVSHCTVAPMMPVPTTTGQCVNPGTIRTELTEGLPHSRRSPLHNTLVECSKLHGFLTGRLPDARSGMDDARMSLRPRSDIPRDLVGRKKSKPYLRSFAISVTTICSVRGLV